MSQDAFYVFLFFCIYFSWVLLPLVPAIVIYRLFPDTKVAAQGPFAGLTLRASGAFAAYFVTMLATVFMANRVADSFSLISQSYWIVTATVRPINADGARDTSALQGEKVRVSFDPAIYTVRGDSVEMLVPKQFGRWPVIKLEVDGHGAKYLDLNNERFAEVGDDTRFVVKQNGANALSITTPIPLRAVSPGATGVDMSRIMPEGALRPVGSSERGGRP